MKKSFGRNLKAIRENKGITQEKLADSLEVTRQTIVRWESGEVDSPRQKEQVARLCEFFGVTENDLFGISDGYYAKSHGLTEAPPGAIAPREPKPAHAPLYGRVHAGNADEPTILDDSIPIPHEVWEHHKSGYFLEVEGTCMNRVYPEGCYVFIDPDMTPQNGSIAVVSIDTEDYIMRRLHRGKSAMILSPESFDDSWDDIVITNREVQLVGTVVWYQSREEME